MAVTISGSSQVVVQAVQTVMTNVFSTSATSFTDLTGMSVSITPSSANSRILILVYLCAGTSGFLSAQVNLVRGGTTLFQNTTYPSLSATFFGSVTSTNDMVNSSFMYIDSPATTSSTTYKLQCRTNSGTLYYGLRGDGVAAWPGAIIAMELSN